MMGKGEAVPIIQSLKIPIHKNDNLITPMDRQTPNVFQYASYRQVIKDLIKTKKDKRQVLIPSLLRPGRFSSSNVRSMVVKGERNLTSTSI